jgi:hypothetical protein
MQASPVRKRCEHGGKTREDDVIDASLIEKLDKSGFIDGLYK